MSEFLDVDYETLFEEVVSRGRNEGITEEEGYNELVEEVIEEHRRVGEQHDDSSTVGHAEQFRSRFAEYRLALGLDKEQPQL